tara:strand:+ start:2149 stop:2655 length:507 start_codon:yes stop_codon:yes gene_type:complete
MSFVVYIVLVSVCFSLAVVKSSDVSRLGKLFLVLLLVHASATVYDSMRKVSGYPSESDLPSDAEIVWGVVWESVEGKSIELWVTFDRDVDDYMFSLSHDEKPISRIYRLPYTKERHRLLLDLQKKIIRGERVGIKSGNNDRNKDKSQDSFVESVERYHVNFQSKKITK